MLNTVPKLRRRCKESKVLRCRSIGGSCLTLQMPRNFGTRKGAANFCIWTFKPLERSYGYALHGFQAHLSKI